MKPKRSLITSIRLLAALAPLAVALACMPASALAQRPLQTAVFDSFAYGSNNSIAYERTRATGATAVRIGLSWRGVAPKRPDHPEDPADPAYYFKFWDSQLAGARAAGLEPIVFINQAPDWAQRAGSGKPGTVNPDPIEFGNFARAAAKRYGGDFGGLPRVRFWQAWSEPNISPVLQSSIRCSGAPRISGPLPNHAGAVRVCGPRSSRGQPGRSGRLVALRLRRGSRTTQVHAKAPMHEGPCATTALVPRKGALRRLGPPPLHERRAHSPSTWQGRRRAG